MSDPIRLRIAEFCSDEPRTRAQIAAELGREAGSLSQPETMVRWGVLKEGTRPKSSDGRPARTFQLKASWKPVLAEARARQAPIWPSPGQELLLIPLADTPDACAALAGGIPEVQWGARVSGGMGGLILAPHLDADGTSTIRIMAALKAIGSRIGALKVGEPMAGPELRDWSARASRVSGELPPGP